MKEKEIRDKKNLVRYMDLVREDSERIFFDKTDFYQDLCPACESDNYKDEFIKYGFNYVSCNFCETLFVNPRPLFDSLMLIYKNTASAEYWINDFFTPVSENRRKKIFRPRAKHIASKFPNIYNKKIGDIGAGFGLFLEELRKIIPEADLVAIEVSKKMSNICIEKNFRVIELPIENVSIAEPHFFMLTAFELFDHLLDVKIALTRINELLEPGGYLFLTCINSLGFDIQVLWNNSLMVCPPLHLNLFNTKSIEILLNKCGFEITELTTPGKLDWEIVENSFADNNSNIGRFFRNVVENTEDQSKKNFQKWLNKSNLSSHMQVIAKKI